MNVVVNGLMTNYQKVGKGPVLVLLHGWGTSATSFKALMPDLAQKHTVLALDLPGFGGTQMPPSAWTLSDYAQFVTDWLKKIGVSKADTVMGHSFGGAIAITGVGQKIIKADKLIVLAASGIRNKQSLRKKTLWLGAKVAKAPLAVLPQSTAIRIKKTLYSKAGSDIMLLPHMKQTFLSTINEDIRPSAQQVNIPALLIYGATDKQTPPADGRLLAEAIPGATLELLPSAGHFLHQEQSSEVTGLINNFLKSSK